MEWQFHLSDLCNGSFSLGILLVCLFLRIVPFPLPVSFRCPSHFCFLFKFLLWFVGDYLPTSASITFVISEKLLFLEWYGVVIVGYRCLFTMKLLFPLVGLRRRSLFLGTMHLFSSLFVLLHGSVRPVIGGLWNSSFSLFFVKLVPFLSPVPVPCLWPSSPLLVLVYIFDFLLWFVSGCLPVIAVSAWVTSVAVP